MTYYIENLIELNVDTEIEIGLNLRIRAATSEEQNVIKSFISAFGLSRILEVAYDGLYKHVIEKRLTEGKGHPKKGLGQDFRYFVLEEMEKTGIYNPNYAKALFLSDKEFFIPFGFDLKDYPRGGVSLKYSFDSELSAYTYFNDKNTNIIERGSEFSIEFTDEDKFQVLDNLTLLNEFEKKKEDYPYIKKALDDFFKMIEISNRSVFKIIQLFACIELLLLDGKLAKPKSSALQLESKLDLINNRIGNPVKVSEFIHVPDSITVGKLIGITHEYKSSIAHGDFLDFEKKIQISNKISELDILILARKVLKSIIVFALKEPQLITDLKKC